MPGTELGGRETKKARCEWSGSRRNREMKQSTVSQETQQKGDPRMDLIKRRFPEAANRN